MTAKELLGQSVLSCKDLLGRFLTGFDDDNRTYQAPHLPNHVIWCLGHCALMMNRAAERIDGQPLPETDFAAGMPPSGTPNAFNLESVNFGSKPSGDTGRYPTLARGRQIYAAACDRLAQAVRAADETALDQTASWGGSQITLWLLVARLVFHNGAHTGQILDMRRALNLGSVLQ